MSQPLFGKQGGLKVDKLLSNISIRYSSENLIADLILPVLKVKERTGLVGKYGKENLRIFGGGLKHTPGTRAKSAEFTVSNGQYACQERQVEGFIPWPYYDNVDDPYDLARDTTALVKDLVIQDREYAISALLNNTAIITQNVTLSGGLKWTAQPTSNPVTDIFTGITTVINSTGRAPNLIVFSRDSFLSFKQHPQTRSYMQYTNGGQKSDADAVAAIKDLFNVPEVLVGKGIYNEAAPGQADSLKPFWTAGVWLIHRQPKPTLMAPTFGMTFCDVLDKVEGYGEIQYSRDVIRDTVSYDQNVLDANLAYAILGTN